MALSSSDLYFLPFTYLSSTLSNWIRSTVWKLCFTTLRMSFKKPGLLGPSNTAILRLSNCSFISVRLANLPKFVEITSRRYLARSRSNSKSPASVYQKADWGWKTLILININILSGKFSPILRISIELPICVLIGVKSTRSFFKLCNSSPASN